MATTDLLLLKPVENLGNEGEQVNVRAGFARNYLLPHGIAILVTKSNRKQIEALRARSEARRKAELDGAKEIAAKLEAIKVAIAVKTGPGGKVFGSVTAQDLLARIKEEGVELEKRQISLHTPAHTLGKHTTRIRLHSEVSIEFEFEIVSENPIEDASADNPQA
ncbi:MAG: 50S ribosomal protein L9 [Opitutales bacterium]|jgi:large subunit ribosomal protein L9